MWFESTTLPNFKQSKNNVMDNYIKDKVKNAVKNAVKLAEKTSQLKNRPSEDVYLEWVNDWAMIERMAEHYNIKPDKLRKIIDKGWQENEAKANK